MPANSTRSRPVSSVTSGIAKRFKLMRSGASRTAARASALIEKTPPTLIVPLCGAVEVVPRRAILRHHLGEERGVASGAAELPEDNPGIDVTPWFGKTLGPGHLRRTFNERQMLEIILAARADRMAALI